MNVSEATLELQGAMEYRRHVKNHPYLYRTNEYEVAERLVIEARAELEEAWNES